LAFKRHKINVLGVQVDDISFKDAVSEILKLARSNDRGKKAKFVVTVNSEFVMLARRDPNFLKILNDADLALPDGQWVVNSKLIVGGKEQDRVTGVDMLEKLCKRAAKKTIRIGFLGGFNGVADAVAKRQKKANVGLKVVFSGSGDPSIGHDLRLKGSLDKVGRIDILFVAYGMGQQEFWIARMRDKLNVGVFIGVGGAFDFIASVKKRAPKYVQNLGFEWLWRLLLDPIRIWRMRVLPLFLLLMMGEALRKKLKF